MPTTQATRPPVLIVGAGLAGLTLAQSLRKQDIAFEIFERDDSVDVRAGGWAIAIHTILGRLKQALIPDVPDLNTKAFVQSTEEQPVLRANRQQLRKLLSSNIDVHWAIKVTEVKQTADGVELILADCSEDHGDVLVGIDGVSSVRSHILANAKPETLPAGMINGEVRLTGEGFKRQLELGNSAYVAGAEDFHLYVGLSSVFLDASGGNYYWFLNVFDPEAVNERYWTADASKKEMLDFAIDKTRALHPRFAEIVRLTPEDGILSRPIVFRDLLIESMPQGRITPVGDAAHLMAPCVLGPDLLEKLLTNATVRGEGGSNALGDALYLSDTLAMATKDAIPFVLKSYEEEMLPRGRGAVSRSRAVLDPKNGAQTAFVWGQDFKFVDLPDDVR